MRIRARPAAAASVVAVAVLLTCNSTNAARPQPGFWYGDGASKGAGSQWWMSFRVVRRHGRMVVRDIMASTHAQACHVEIDPRARRVRNGGIARPGVGINLGTLSVDARGRFRDEVPGGHSFFEHARFTGRRRAAGVLRWNDPREAGSPFCTGEELIGRERFRIAPAGPPPLAVGHWSGVVAAQDIGGRQIAEQPLGFDVLSGGRFMRVGSPRFELLVHCSTDPDVYEPQSVGASDPFGSIRGKRAIPPRPDFTLNQEPRVVGDSFRWQMATNGSDATGLVEWGSLGPGSGCAGSVPWTAVAPSSAKTPHPFEGAGF